MGMLAAVVVAGCTGGGDRPAVPEPPSQAVLAWERPDLKPVSEPALAGDLFVVYVAVPSGLSMISLDPDTGRTVWQMEVSRARTGPRTSSPVAVVAGNVIIFRSAEGFDQLVAVDPKSGVEKWASRPGTFNEWPDACHDDALIVCTFGRDTTSTDPERPLRFAGDSGAPQPSPLVSDHSFAVGRRIAPGLFGAGPRHPETLVATNGSALLWSRPISEVFPGEGMSSDNGGIINRIPNVGVFVGSILGPPIEHSDTHAKIDLARSTTVGFRIEDGRVLWSEPGTRYLCGVLRCPHRHEPGTDKFTEVTQGVRVRATGTAVYEQPREPRLEAGAAVMLEGFDLATGKTIWSFDSGTDVRLVTSQSPPLVSEDALALVEPGGKPFGLSLLTGARRGLPADVVAWCRASTSYDAPPGHSPSYAATRFPGLLSHQPCDMTGKPVPIPSKVPTFVGPMIRATLAMSASDRVIGVRTTT